MSKSEDCRRLPEGESVFSRFSHLTDRLLLPDLVHSQEDNVAKSIAVSFMRQTGRIISPAESFVVAEYGRGIVIDVMCKSLKAQDLREGLSSRAALEGHVEEVKAMLASFSDDSSKEGVIATAEIIKAYLELQKQGVHHSGDPRVTGALRPGINRLARAVYLSEQEGKMPLVVFIPLMAPALVPATR